MSEQPWSGFARRRRTHQLHDGKTIELEELSIADLEQVSAEALSSYRRAHIKSLTENLDLIESQETRDRMMQEAFREASNIKQEDLPRKRLSLRIASNNGQPQEVDYWIWWMSETFEGMTYVAWLSMRRCQSQRDLTRDDVAAILTSETANAISNRENLVGVSNALGEMMEPSKDLKEAMGNSSSPRRRRKRRGR